MEVNYQFVVKEHKESLSCDWEKNLCLNMVSTTVKNPLFRQKWNFFLFSDGNMKKNKEIV